MKGLTKNEQDLYTIEAYNKTIFRRLAACRRALEEIDRTFYGLVGKVDSYNTTLYHSSKIAKRIARLLKGVSFGKERK